jgi:GT2 family glycosyltransferase
MLVSKKVFNQAGGFDEVNLTVAFNDVDLCLKIRELNYRIVWAPLAELYHHESISRGEDIIEDANKRFIKENEFMYKKWAKWIEDDPAYSPNLTLITEDFSLAWPSRLEKIL